MPPVRRGLGKFVGRDVGGEHARAEMREGLRDAPAEAVAGAGDGNGLAVEADVHGAS